MEKIEATELVELNKAKKADLDSSLDKTADIEKESIKKLSPQSESNLQSNNKPTSKQTQLETPTIKPEESNSEFTKNLHDEKEQKPLAKPQEESKEKISNTISCLSCGLMMTYPPGSFFVACPNCKAVSPTIEVQPLKCQFCQLLSYFPKGSPIVKCNCGAIYSIKI
ncbi:hypothetical protein SteCoe_5154 [Stentor coeruleus]|uniref:Zinc finger LSD1-type domain-containing protein n=1 Tax=Stentor coeruleus TaxID=5963 RepID=A0A1R2CT26_9CILI|nr:hypothetical protein SteCoe_5154 [Stentor coeruleus]